VCEEREVPRKAEYSTEQVHICFISCTPDSEYKGEKNMTEPLSDGEKNPHLSVKWIGTEAVCDMYLTDDQWATHSGSVSAPEQI